MASSVLYYKTIRLDNEVTRGVNRRKKINSNLSMSHSNLMHTVRKDQQSMRLVTIVSLWRNNGEIKTGIRRIKVVNIGSFDV